MRKVYCALILAALIPVAALAQPTQPLASTFRPDAPVDIKPHSCPNPLNTNAKGVLPAAILGTEELDPTSIDPSSIKLVREAEVWQVDSPAWLTLPDGTVWMEDLGNPVNSPINTMEFSAHGMITGAHLIDCGLALDPSDIPPAAVGNICLIERGLTFFQTKVQIAEAGGAVAAIIYNREDQGPLNFGGTLVSPSGIPAVSTSWNNGQTLLEMAGHPADLQVLTSLNFVTWEVQPTSWAYEDVGTPVDGPLCACTEDGPDGYMDLLLKFDNAEVVEGLMLPSAPGELNPIGIAFLRIEGVMFDGETVRGTDCVVLKQPRGRGSQ